MAADSNRRPRDEPFPQHDSDRAADGMTAVHGEETLAEKIRRYRQPVPGATGGASVSGSRVVRSSREG
jgi:hypothetical protein